MGWNKEKWVTEHIIKAGFLGSAAPTNDASEIMAGKPPALRVYHFMTRGPGDAPTEIYIGLECLGGLPDHVYNLLVVHGFKFDYFRDIAPVAVDGKRVVLFGADGAPFINKDGTVLVRFFKKVDDKNVILDIAQRFPRALEAQATIKKVFARFDDMQPVEVLKKFQPVFGES